MKAHPLARFLAESELSTAALARKARVSRPTISKVLHGRRRRFSPDAAQRLSAATGGRVSVLELLGIASPRKRTRSPEHPATPGAKP
jgi:transcriptional regulator with XRE-family HTH domain